MQLTTSRQFYIFADADIYTEIILGSVDPQAPGIHFDATVKLNEGEHYWLGGQVISAIDRDTHLPANLSWCHAITDQPGGNAMSSVLGELGSWVNADAEMAFIVYAKTYWNDDFFSFPYFCANTPIGLVAFGGVARRTGRRNEKKNCSTE